MGVNFYDCGIGNLSQVGPFHTTQVRMIFLWVAFSCGKAVDNVRRRKLFHDEVNRYCLDLILGERDRNCCYKENLRCINSYINEMF